MSRSIKTLIAVFFMFITGCVASNRSETGIFQINNSGLQKMINSAKAGDTVIVPEGTYKKSIEINKPITLKGISADLCIFEITADKPAIFVDTSGKGDVRIENVTVKWQLKTSSKTEKPYAVSIKDSNVTVAGCSFIPLGNTKRCPVALRVDGFSDVTIDGCEFTGFEYTVCYGPDTAGTVKNSTVTGSGHQGVTLYSGAKVNITSNIITDSKYHGVRNTGGKMTLTDNILANNRVSGAYLGNKNSEGFISNNLFLDNKVGIMSFYIQQYDITNNVVTGSSDAGISFDKACMLSIDKNILANNNTGMSMYDKRPGEYSNKIMANVLFGNSTDVKNIPEGATMISQDPAFADVENGNFGSNNIKTDTGSAGLTDAKVIAELWGKWKTPKTVSSKPTKAIAPQVAPIRVGTYDSRAIAVAFVNSRGSNEQYEAKKKEMDKAQAAGDIEKIAELNAWGKAKQHKQHLQGFSTAPVHEFIEKVKKDLTKIAKASNVDVIVSKWEFDYQSRNAQTVDVTDAIIKLYNPSEKTLKIIKELRKHKPVTEEDILKHPH